MVGNDINRKGGTFQVMPPCLESLEDGEKFLVVDVVIQFCRSESAGMESNGVEFRIGSEDGKDSSKSVVRGVGFHDNL